MPKSSIPAQAAGVEPIHPEDKAGTEFGATQEFTQNLAQEFTQNLTQLLQLIQTHLPDLLACYAFGSRIQGTSAADSDLDLAVLVAGYADPFLLFDLSGALTDAAGYPVDFLDLRAASTVMQYQIITTGVRYWQKDSQAALFEAAVLSEKTALDTARRGLINDIQQRGNVYGR